MSRDETFSQIIEKLLLGRIICEYSYESEFRYLQNDVNRISINDYLNRIGRALCQTLDGQAFFAAYSHLDTDDRRAAVRSQLADVINSLEPLTAWLNMAQSAMRSDRPVTPGDTLKTSSLLEAVEDSPALCDQIASLSRMKLLTNSQSTIKGQLDSILKKLVELGYLIPSGRAGTQFVAAGKWSRLYDLMGFIRSHEQLDGDEDAIDQETLSL